MLLSPILLILVVAGIIYFATENETAVQEAELAVLTDDPAIAQMLVESSDGLTVNEAIDSEEEARAQIAAEELDGYLVVYWEENQLNAELAHNRKIDNHIPVIEQALTNMQVFIRASELNLTSEQLQSLNEPINLDTQVLSIEAGEITEEDDLGLAIQLGSAYFINIVILMFILSYASTVIQEVAGEKGTRMMEVILSSTTATTHFFGKIIGVFLVMLVHILFYVIIGFGAYMYFKDHELIQPIIQDLDVGAIILTFLQYSMIFLVIGVVMYMFIAAFLGSLITKTEDINKAATPLSLLTMLGFYIGLFAMASPESSIVVISSFIPLLTPFVMPFRIATGTVPTLHVWLSIGGSAVFTIALAYISLIFYRANVLIYSDTTVINTLKQSWALVRSEHKGLL